MSWKSIPVLMMRNARWCAWMRPQNSSLPKPERRWPMKPGLPARYDYEYKRGGTASLFMLFAPLEGLSACGRQGQRTSKDYAHVLKDLSDVHFAGAEKIVLVQDNLNTHTPASLTKPLSLKRRAVSLSGSSGVIRQNTAVGSTWPKRNWLSSPNSASTSASKIRQR